MFYRTTMSSQKASKYFLLYALFFVFEQAEAQTAITKPAFDYVAINCLERGQRFQLVGSELYVDDSASIEQKYRYRIPLDKVSFMGIAVRESPFPFILQCNQPGCISFEHMRKDWYDFDLKVKNREPVNDFKGACVPPNGVNAFNDLVSSLGGNANTNPYNSPTDLSKSRK